MNEADPSQDPDGASDGIRDIMRTLKSMSADMVRLVVVETRLFGHTVLAMIGLTVVIALLLVGVWLFAGAALVMALASLQAFNLTGALLTVALGHLVLAGLAFWRLRHITRDLTFRESRASVNSLLNHARSQVDETGQPPQEQ
ncbi:MAG: phage holin family protein [Thioalkalivibrio sp.]